MGPATKWFRILRHTEFRFHPLTTAIPPFFIMECESKEDRIQLVLKAFKTGQFKTIKAAALAFDVPKSTLGR